MSPMRPCRLVDEDVLRARRAEPCVVCGGRPPSDPSHIKSRGAGGGDFMWNVAPHCRPCHSRWHSMGKVKFVEKYPAMREWLEAQGWDLTEPLNWIPPA